MENDSTLYVGLDVHKDSITVAYALDAGEVECSARSARRKADIDRLCKRLQSKAHARARRLRGRSCGYGLYRQLVAERLRLHGVRTVADPAESPASA